MGTQEHQIHQWCNITLNSCQLAAKTFSTSLLHHANMLRQHSTWSHSHLVGSNQGEEPLYHFNVIKMLCSQAVLQLGHMQYCKCSPVGSCSLLVAGVGWLVVWSLTHQHYCSPSS